MPSPDDDRSTASKLLRFAPRAVAALVAALYAGDVVSLEVGGALFIGAMLADVWVRRRMP